MKPPGSRSGLRPEPLPAGWIPPKAIVSVRAGADGIGVVRLNLGKTLSRASQSKPEGWLRRAREWRADVSVDKLRL